MTRSDLVEVLEQEQNQLSARDVELAVKTMLERMSETLASCERIEIRGFGSFTLHFRAPRIGRNPKTGESVAPSRQVRPALQARQSAAGAGECGGRRLIRVDPFLRVDAIDVDREFFM
jgi:integration host factor subunit beta